MKLTAKDINGIVGIVPTPATPDGGRWDAMSTVNLPESEKMVRNIVDAGVDIIMTTGTFGECASLTWEELRDFVDCVVRTVNRKRPVFAGVTCLNTRDTITRGRALVALGADGLFIGRPMWLAMDDQAIVRFYQDLAEAMPKVPLCVYDNPAAFKGKLSTEVYRELARIPEVVAAKHIGGPAMENDLLTVGDKVRILPIEGHWAPLAQKHPELATACWSGNVACGPAPSVALWKAIRARNWALAQEITDKMNAAVAPMFPDGQLAKFMDYSIPLGHARFASSGYINPGPARPPYRDAPADYIAGSTEAGKRWKKLQQEFQ